FWQGLLMKWIKVLIGVVVLSVAGGAGIAVGMNMKEYGRWFIQTRLKPFPHRNQKKSLLLLTQ
ncbi:hypothetical protein ABES27_05905, partial [Heyndrickxia coagulans]